MNERTLVGLLLLVSGVSVYRYAYELARLSERLDSIGSTTAWGDVEPANWMVVLYQVASLIAAGVGGLALIVGVI